MGTSGAYGGSGGAIGDRIRESVSELIDSLTAGKEAPSDDSGGGELPHAPAPPRLDPKVLLPTVGLLRTRMPGGGSGDGPGAGGSANHGGGGSAGGRRSGGPVRTAVAAARSAGRAAAAAYAYRTGDVTGLERLGLNYAELRELGDSFEVTRRIVDAACGQQASSTIEDHEQRLVAADVAEWVLAQDLGDHAPDPEEIVRHTIALVIAEVVLSEAGKIINDSEHCELAEQEIRDAAEALAAREALSADGVSETEFAAAIERGIETLRRILEE